MRWPERGQDLGQVGRDVSAPSRGGDIGPPVLQGTVGGQPSTPREPPCKTTEMGPGSPGLPLSEFIGVLFSPIIAKSQ